MEINGFNIEPIEGEAGVHDVSFSPTSVNESLDKVVEIDAVAGDKTARVTLIHEGMREIFNVTEGAFMVTEGTFNVLKEIKEEPITYGVYIQDTTGKLWTTDVWDGSATPNGVAVIDERCKFIVGQTFGSYAMIRNTALPDNMPIYESKDNALNDYNGAFNTQMLPSDSYAKGFVNNNPFPNGEIGYIPACGELNVLIEKITLINDAFDKLSWSKITSSSGNIWSSTFLYRFSIAWNLEAWGYSQDYSDMRNFVATNSNTVCILLPLDIEITN